MSAALEKADWQSQIDLVKSMCAPTATKEEFSLMCHIATKYGLDPLVKQIWVVKYGSQPASIFTGRDGFLSIAHRTGQFAGIETRVEKIDEKIHVKKKRKKDGAWVEIEVKRDWQYKAVCTIHRTDAAHPFICEVYEEEYTTCENLWTTKTRTMIGKVAESQCLRKAFDISGLYSPEEMPEQEEKDITPKTETAQEKFEREKGIGKDPAPTETEEQKAAREIAETRLKRLRAMPADVIEFFKAQKWNNGKIFAVMDENNDDPELIRGLMGDTPKPEMLKQGEEVMAF